MKSSAAFHLASFVLAAAAAASESQEVQYPEPQPPPLTNLVWRLPAKYATLDGDRLVVDIPPDAYPADAVATAEVPAALLEGAKGFAMSVSAKGEGLVKPIQSWLGLKFQLHWQDAGTGRENWPNVKGVVGDFPATVLLNETSFGDGRPFFAELQLGLQGTSGRVEFDLSTLRAGPAPGLFRRVNADWVVRYPDDPVRVDAKDKPAKPAMTNAAEAANDAVLRTNDAVLRTNDAVLRTNDAVLRTNDVDASRQKTNDDSLALPASPARHSPRRQPRRGVMLPARAATEADFIELARWGVTLARYQMVRNWSGVDDNRDLDEYATWIDSKLDCLEMTVIPCARKYGMKIVVDLHVTPGGRNAAREMAMFRDARYADAFVETWRRIATRFKGNADVIYGYDLVNEPTQYGRAPFDYWTLQRRAAEVVRAIDPDTAIIIESNDWDSPAAFSYLSPLRMDNVIYQVHCYGPMDFTHQGVGGRAKGPVWPDLAREWDRDLIRRALAPVRDFEKRHGARIYVGEFSAAAWAPGAENYLRDCIEVFEEYGWDWSYHAFREWSGWSVEHEGPDSAHMVPSVDNPRRRVLLEGFRRP